MSETDLVAELVRVREIASPPTTSFATGTTGTFGRERPAPASSSSAGRTQPLPERSAYGHRLRQLLPAPDHQARPAGRAWARANNVEIAYTPTYSSWLYRIEAQFTALRYFAFDGTDHRTHQEQGSMIRRYIAWEIGTLKTTNIAASSTGRTQSETALGGAEYAYSVTRS